MKGPIERTKREPTPAPAIYKDTDFGRSLYIKKVRAVEHAAAGVLSRIEQLLHQEPTLILNKQSTLLPREIEDGQAYLLDKIAHARAILGELGNLLHVSDEKVDLRELISAELMTLMVLFEIYRPKRMLQSGWKPGKQFEDLFEEKLEQLDLDVINMRERLK